MKTISHIPIQTLFLPHPYFPFLKIISIIYFIFLIYLFSISQIHIPHWAFFLLSNQTLLSYVCICVQLLVCRDLTIGYFHVNLDSSTTGNVKASNWWWLKDKTFALFCLNSLPVSICFSIFFIFHLFLTYSLSALKNE